MSKSITKNYIYNVSYQIIVLLTPLITTPYVSRVLGPEGIGIYSYTTSIVAYFILIGTAGLTEYGQREVAYYQNNKKDCSRIFYEVTIVRTTVVFFSLFLYYIIVLKDAETNYLIFFIQAINIVALLFDTTWFFQGLEEFGKVIMRNLMVRIVSICFLFIFIKSADDLWFYVLMNSTISLCGGAWVCFYLPKYLVKVPFYEIKPLRNSKIILQLFLPQIAIQVYTVLDKTMIGIFTGMPAENGYYEQAEKCVKMSIMVVTSLGTVMLPRIASSYASGDFQVVYQYIMKSFRFIWFLSLPVMAIIVAVSPNFVPWFFGPGYDKVIILLQLFSPLLIAIGLSNVIGIQYLVATNQQNLMTVSVVVGAIINFIFNIILIPKFFSVGAAVASIIAEFGVTFVQLYMVRRTFKVGDVIELSRQYVSLATASLVVMLALSNVLEPSFCHSLIIVTLGGGCYVFGLFIKKDVFFMRSLEKIKNLFNKYK